jgi:hypothetical protein
MVRAWGVAPHRFGRWTLSDNYADVGTEDAQISRDRVAETTA